MSITIESYLDEIEQLYAQLNKAEATISVLEMENKEFENQVFALQMDVIALEDERNDLQYRLDEYE